MAKFRIGDREYPSKGEAQLAIRKILNRKTHSLRLQGDDHDFMVDLFEMHPNQIDKLGSGLGWFKSEPDGYGNRCFIHVDTQGTEIVWSYLTCLTPKSLKTHVRTALREAVDYQIKPMRRWQHEVDHINPGGFGVLADRFVAHCGGLDKIEIEPARHGTVMTDYHQTFLWQEFHQRFAQLELVTIEEHKARTAARKRDVRVG